MMIGEHGRVLGSRAEPSTFDFYWSLSPPGDALTCNRMKLSDAFVSCSMSLCHPSTAICNSKLTFLYTD